ncbi:MAG TPA: hypothetical protein EYG60_04125 [Campylobacterales bacterium]|nr:hypothetical protein [Campylobacterales bacterium]
MRLIDSRYIELLKTETTKLLKDIHVDRLLQKNEKIRLAVTGLSRSGKTVFITSFINQLISGKKIESVMEKRGKRFIAKIAPKPKQFDYFSIVDNFRNTIPKWPRSTSSISKIDIRLEVKSNNKLLPNKFIDIEIIDYPGEWILDIGMAYMDFDEWSEKSLFQLRNKSKKALAQAWQSELNKHDIYGASDEDDEIAIIEQYRNYLDKLKQNGFFYIQPNILESEKLLFTPLPKPKYITPNENSIYSRFQKRYQEYIDEVVRPIAIDYFSNFDRQIVLVDILQPLQYGYNSFLDLTSVIRELVSIYKYGERSFLKPILEGRIDRVLFGATKADYLPKEQHEKFHKLLDLIVEEARRELDIKNIETETVVLASVVGDREKASWKTENIPDKFSKDSRLKFPTIPPCRFPDRDIEAVEHINLDRVVDFLIGDKL